MRKWKWLTLLIASSMLLGGCAMGGASGTKTTQGIAALDDGNYTQAQQLFEEAVQEDEEQMLAWRGLGLADMGLAQYEEAETAFQNALDAADEKMPENTQDLKLYLAAVEYRLAEYEKTIDTCTEILDAQEKGVADAYYLRGAAQLHEGNQKDAKADFDSAVKLMPDDYDLYLNIYETYRVMNLSAVGGEYLQSALAIEGTEQEDYYNRGRIYFYLGDYDKAQSELIKVVEQKYEPAMTLMGRVYLAQEDYDHAEAVYETLHQLGADDRPVITVFNKQDLLAEPKSFHDHHAELCVAASARTGQGMEEIKAGIEQILRSQKIYIERLYPYDQAGLIQIIRRKGELLSEEYQAEGIFVKAYVTKDIYMKV